MAFMALRPGPSGPGQMGPPFGLDQPFTPNNYYSMNYAPQNLAASPPPPDPGTRMATTRIFGINVPNRAVRAFVGGLGGMPQPNPHAGFFANLVRGLGGGAGAATATSEKEQANERMLAQLGMMMGYKNRMATNAENRTDIYGQHAEDLGQHYGNIDTDRAYALSQPKGLAATVATWKQLGMSDDQIMANLTAPGERIDIGRQRLAQALGGGAAPLDDATKDMLAWNLLSTGQLPAMGMGGMPLRQEIFSRAAHYFDPGHPGYTGGGAPVGAQTPGTTQPTGTTQTPPAPPDIASNQAAFRANRASLSTLTTQRNNIYAFENTAAQNSKIVSEFVDKIPQLGVRFGNNIGRYVASQAGDPNVASYSAALNTVMNEYARIVTQFGGTNMLTDTARKEMQAVMSGDYTKQQLMNVLDVMRRDAANRRSALDTQIQSVKGNIKQTPFQNKGGVGAGSGLAPATADQADPLGLRGGK